MSQLPLSPLVGALQALDLGLRVFPVLPGSKRPAVGGWQEWAAEADREKIEAYHTLHPTTNWGIHCEGLVVVDLDRKHGHDGFVTLREILEATEGATEEELMSLRVQTPSGGRHIYLRLPEGEKVRNFVRVRPGIDVRSTGGLVVCWGSIADGRMYVPVGVDEGQLPPILPCPAWLLALLQERAAETTYAEGAIPEGTRNQSLFGAACGMRYVGMSESEIFGALCLINANRVIPPLAEWELRRIAANAAKFEPRAARLAPLWGDELQGEPAHAGVTGRQLLGSQPPKRRWIMRGRYLAEHLTLLYGPGGSGKSTLLLADAVSMVTGQPYSGAEVIEPGPCWLHQAEDPMDEIWRRLAALAQQHKILPEALDELYITDAQRTPLLLAAGHRDQVEPNEAAITWMIHRIKALGIKLLLLDPWVGLHRTDESSNTAAMAVVQLLLRIMSATGCAVGVGHHRSKAGANRDEAEGARGASALVNAARLVYLFRPLHHRDPLGAKVDTATRKRLVLLQAVKANMLPPGGHSVLFGRHSELVAEEPIGILRPYSSAQLEELLADAQKAAEELADPEPPPPPQPEARASMSLAKAITKISSEDDKAHILAKAAELEACEVLHLKPEDLAAKPLAERIGIGLALFRDWAINALPPEGMPLAQVRIAAGKLLWGAALLRSSEYGPATFAKHIQVILSTYSQHLHWTSPDGPKMLRVERKPGRGGNRLRWLAAQ